MSGEWVTKAKLTEFGYWSGRSLIPNRLLFYNRLLGPIVQTSVLKTWTKNDKWAEYVVIPWCILNYQMVLNVLHRSAIYRNDPYSQTLIIHEGPRLYLDKGKIGRLKVPSTGISSRVGSIKLPSETLGDGLLVSLLGKMASMILKLSLRLEDCEVCGKRLLWGWPLIDAKRLISIFWSRTPLIVLFLQSSKSSNLPSRRLSRTDLLSGSGADDSFRDFLKSKISSN